MNRILRLLLPTFAAVAFGALALAPPSQAKPNGYTPHAISECWLCVNLCEDAWTTCLASGGGSACDVAYSNCLAGCPFGGDCSPFGPAVFEQAFQAAATIDATLAPMGGGSGVPTSVVDTFPHVEAELISAAIKIDEQLARAERRLAEAIAEAEDEMERVRLVELLVAVARARAAIGEEGMSCLAETARR